jgi:hypothetical protein
MARRDEGNDTLDRFLVGPTILGWPGVAPQPAHDPKR